jgi:Putative beta-barrel porin-2, OmpL-like. bbp2
VSGTIGLALLAVICGLGSVFMVCFFTALCRETRTHVVLKRHPIFTPSGTQPVLSFDAFQHPQQRPMASVIQIDVVAARRKKEGVVQKPMGPAKLLELPLLSDRNVSRHTHLKRVGARWSGLFLLLCLLATSSLAQDTTPNSSDEIQQLKSMVQQLQARVTQLEKQQGSAGSATPADAASPSSSAVASDPTPAQTAQPQTVAAEDRSILDFLRDSTINVGVDTYYAYNFNAPIGRVNVLRAYDVLSNEFSLNQASLIFDHPADVEAGRRWGGRVDLQFGQATDTLQGNPFNEPRPDIYRNIFQAYGTYIIPLGAGVHADFGKFASSLGIEGNYTKDQMNYSRSYWFDVLPFYHMGLRASYPVNDRFAVNYWIVNGINQTEATNGFKDQLFGFTAKPRKSISWTANYYFGQEHPDRAVATNCGPPPVQPGLCFTAIRPAPNGRTHIFDSYVTWQATPKLTFALEGDYFLQRLWRNASPGESSAPSHVDGGAAYVQYQFLPKMAVASRAEYVADPDGLFSGIGEYLKEVTLTYSYSIADGFLLRTEYRRDFSSQPVFLTDTPGVLSEHQTTATLGLTWWWGRKEGAW